MYSTRKASSMHIYSRTRAIYWSQRIVRIRAAACDVAIGQQCMSKIKPEAGNTRHQARTPCAHAARHTARTHRTHPHSRVAHTVPTHTCSQHTTRCRCSPPRPTTHTHLLGAHPHTSPGTEHTARARWANTAAYAHTALVAPLHTHVSFDTAMHLPQPPCLIYEGSVTASLAREVMWAAPEGSRPEAPRRPSADPTQARGATRERGTPASH